MKSGLFVVFATVLCQVSSFDRIPFDPRLIRHRRSISSKSDSTPSTNSKEQINPKWNSTWIDKLKRDLLLNYDKYVLPISTVDKNKTVVRFNPAINHIEVDESRSILTIHCWVAMSWSDPKLKWDPADYGDVNHFRVGDHEIWQPDVLPYNSATGNAVDNYGSSYMIAYNSGDVMWVPPSIIHTFCDFDLRKWPFDTQKCSMKFGSWSYSSDQFDLSPYHLDNNPVDEDKIIENAEWKLVQWQYTRDELYRHCCTEPYFFLTYNITIERRTPVYKALVVTPATSIVLMTLAIFWLPPSSSDKIKLGAITTIMICLFILYFTRTISATAGNTPLIVLFYTSSLYLVSFSLVISVIVINLSKNPKIIPIPWIIKSHLTDRLGRYLLIENYISQISSFRHSLAKSSLSEEMTDSQTIFTEQPDLPEGYSAEITNNKSYQKDWILLATAIDRLAFLVYCFLFIIFALAYSI